jgi:hypothetical protein
VVNNKKFNAMMIIKINAKFHWKMMGIFFYGSFMHVLIVLIV